MRRVPIQFMTFPNLTRTKTEALQLAAELFPGERVALARLKPGTTHPRYQVTHDTADTLRAVFFWLHEQKPRIYKRARIPLPERGLFHSGWAYRQPRPAPKGKPFGIHHVSRPRHLATLK